MFSGFCTYVLDWLIQWQESVKSISAENIAEEKLIFFIFNRQFSQKAYYILSLQPVLQYMYEKYLVEIDEYHLTMVG